MIKYILSVMSIVSLLGCAGGDQSANDTSQLNLATWNMTCTKFDSSAYKNKDRFPECKDVANPKYELLLTLKDIGSKTHVLLANGYIHCGGYKYAFMSTYDYEPNRDRLENDRLINNSFVENGIFKVVVDSYYDFDPRHFVENPHGTIRHLKLDYRGDSRNLNLVFRTIKRDYSVDQKSVLMLNGMTCI